jgi:hypothetical protein
MGQITTESPQNYRIQLDLPPALYRRLANEAAHRSATVDQFARQVLERHAESEEMNYDITRTRTWQLCGTLEVAEPDREYVTGRDEQGNAGTNYAEHVDDLLYRGG